MRRASAIILLILTVTPLLIGCWDRIDIETRAYILGIAIDKYPPDPSQAEEEDPEAGSPKEEEKFEKMELHAGKPRYAMTVQIPILKKAGTMSAGTGSSGGGGEGSRTWEITQFGSSFMSMNREILSRTNLIPYYEHLQVIIISEDVARSGVEDVLDFFVRDQEMRRRVKVFVTSGQAKSILDVKPRTEDFSSMYLAHIPMNSTKNSRMVHEVDLGEIVNYIHQGYDFVLPRVEATKDEIKASGAAVFKKHNMVGWLSELEVEAFKLLINRFLGGVIVTEITEEMADEVTGKGLIVLEVLRTHTKITPLIEGENPSVKIDIKIEGNYAEEVNMHTHGKLHKDFLIKAEKQFAKEVEGLCRKTIKKVQQEFGADIFLFGHAFKTKKPAYWKQVEKDWDVIFPELEVDINVDVDIILTGIIR